MSDDLDYYPCECGDDGDSFAMCPACAAKIELKNKADHIAALEADLTLWKGCADKYEQQRDELADALRQIEAQGSRDPLSHTKVDACAATARVALAKLENNDD